MTLIPMVIEKTMDGERCFDIYSKLLENRIILLTGPIDDAMASSIIAQLLYLESINRKEDIYLYINSPGGSVTSGLAIYDTIQFLSCDVVTICIGICASMASLILACGTKGKRYALLNSEVMIHQPLGQTAGQASDIIIAANHMQEAKLKLAKLLAKHTKQKLETVLLDTERDYYLSSKEALDYGLIDEILLKNAN